MGKYSLMVQRRISQRMSWKLALLAALMLTLGLYDQFTGILGPNWFWLWPALLAVLILWFYYGVLMRRAAVHIGSGHIRLQGPLYGRKISFRRIRMITPGKLEQHYPYEDLRLGERPLLKPLYHRTCTFVELTSYPESFKRRRWWFPRTLFGTSKRGLLCHVEDWMSFSRDLESVRVRYQAQQEIDAGRRPMTLAGRILAEDTHFQ